MNIRPMEPRDLEAVNCLLEQVLDVHHRGRPDLFRAGTKKYTDEQLLAILRDENRPIFVAEEEGRLLGYAFCIFQSTKGSNVLTDIKTLYIDDLCVDETARRGGVGKALYHYVKAFALRQGCYNLTLNVWGCNHSAMGFYEAMGMTVQKTTMEQIL